jgi:4'-phosphopantetheinyl transferase
MVEMELRGLPGRDVLVNEDVAFVLPFDQISFAGLLPALSEEERRKASRFACEQDAACYVVTHWLKRHVLAYYLGRDPRAIQFLDGVHGKPYVFGNSIDFNISHARGCAALIVSQYGPVGIDVENPTAREKIDSEQLYDFVFHPEELVEVRRGESGESVFYLYWTLKEAVSKALGVGLTIPFSSIFLQAEEEGRYLYSSDKGGAWQLRCYRIGDVYLSLCSQRTVRCYCVDVSFGMLQMDD